MQTELGQGTSSTRGPLSFSCVLARVSSPGLLSPWRLWSSWNPSYCCCSYIHYQNMKWALQSYCGEQFHPSYEDGRVSVPIKVSEDNLVLSVDQTMLVDPILLVSSSSWCHCTWQLSSAACQIHNGHIVGRNLVGHASNLAFCSDLGWPGL